MPDIVTVAVIIVASTLGGGAYWLVARAVRPSLAFALGLLVALLVYASGGAVLAL